LKECAEQLAKPVQLLTLLILLVGIWPDVWTLHWITPLYKKSSLFAANNYRGIHLTSQLSKVVERLVKGLVQPYISQTLAFGPNQFAYSEGRGARDALAFLTLVWIKALALGRKIGVYCSDVSGAFDRVSLTRLVAKLRAKKLNPKLVSVLESWLRQRTSHVVVGGCMSETMLLVDMVFQGTVLGPTLWNTFFEDARKAINEVLFEEIVYADDLNAYREFSATTSNSSVRKCITMCQQELHTWGRANQVQFDAGKESQHILTLNDPAGTLFKLLGVVFDDSLSMADAVASVVSEASWKLRTLLRTKRFYTDADLIVLYKAHLLSFLEYRTPAIYHATRVILERLFAVQTRFLRDANVDQVEALVKFRLAPLAVRRDIAMLGVIHRSVLGRGPNHFNKFFVLDTSAVSKHRRQLVDPRKEMKHPLIRRSVFGLVSIYNLLPASIVEAKTVSAFQQGLQHLVTERAKGGCDDWMNTLSPRQPIETHPLNSL